MELKLDRLRELLKPLQFEAECPAYYKAFFEKCNALHDEKQRLLRIADTYEEPPAEELHVKMILGRSIIYLSEKVVELETLWHNIHYKEKDVKWPSRFEWTFCEEIAELCYLYIMEIAERLDDAFRCIGLLRTEGAYLQIETMKKSNPASLN